ncbi:MAG: hypothetical protein AAFY88_02650 [Acidobacteriota bacterium]
MKALGTALDSPLLALLRVDVLRVRRDRFLLGLIVLIFSMCLGLRMAIPWIAREVWVRWAFDLEPYFVLLGGHISVVVPTVTMSILGGFLVLEMREEGVLRALLASPVPLRRYLHGLAVAFALGATVLAVAHAALIGLALPPWTALAVIAAASSVAAAPQALFVAAASKNKVEAMAYTKVVSGVAPIALAAFFIPEPWQWLCGVYPPYWAVKAYWLAYAGDGGWALWALGAPVTSWLWWRVVLRTFTAAAYR